MGEEVPSDRAKRVGCICNGVRVKGTYEVEDGFLILTAPFGETRVALGLRKPQRLAATLMKNLCMKATEPEQSCCGAPQAKPSSLASTKQALEPVAVPEKP